MDDLILGMAILVLFLYFFVWRGLLRPHLSSNYARCLFCPGKNYKGQIEIEDWKNMCPSCQAEFDKLKSEPRPRALHDSLYEELDGK